jgi:peptide/nickel transport system substrate-binding protein
MGVVASLAAFPAMAQKAKDTLRIAVTTNVPQLSIYEFAQPDADFFYRELYDNLMLYNEEKKIFEPRLAKSAKQVGPTTIEFELRDDITFHNGNKMDADDAVYTLNWTVAPETKMFLQNRYTGVIKSAEKTGPYTFRLHTVAPTAIDMLRLRSFFVLDSEFHKPLSDKSEYGRKGIGTGPMQVTSFEPGQKLVMTRFKDYRLGKPNEIGRIEGYFIGDQQTQIAQLLTGGIDLMRNPTQDQITEFSKRPGFAASVTEGNNILYMTYDTINRSEEAKALTDLRVRRAIIMALDRELLIKQIGVQGQDPRPLPAMCISSMIACIHNTTAPGFNRDEAKRLLKEAGYEKGFKLEVTTTPQYRPWAEAIVGELRKVGIEAVVNPQAEVVTRKLRSTGKIQMAMENLPVLAIPDAHLTYQVNFGNRSELYIKDDEFLKLGEEGLSTRDPALRDRIYAQMFDRINDQMYLLPLTAMPSTYLHAAEVFYRQTPGFKFTPRITDFHWK